MVHGARALRPRGEHNSRASTLEEFMANIASRDRSQGRLSVAALAAGCCAAQLEAQCREVLVYRQQAPGPSPIEPLITELQAVRSRLGAFIPEAMAMETASTQTMVLPDSCLDERLRKQAASETLLTQFVVEGIKAAALIRTIGRIAQQVRRLRSEVRGGPPTEEAMLAAASMAVLDVIERALRMSRVRDPRLRAVGFRAIACLRPLCVPSSLTDDELEHTAPGDDQSRWN
jgi:hypothetical protein